MEPGHAPEETGRGLCSDVPPHTPEEAARDPCSGVPPSKHVAVGATGHGAGQIAVRITKHQHEDLGRLSLEYVRLDYLGHPVQHAQRVIHGCTILGQRPLEYVRRRVH